MFIQLFAWEDTVQDLFFETIAFQRIALVAKLVATGECSGEEKDLALAWLSELTTELEKKLDGYEKENTKCGGVSREGCRFC